MTCTCSVVRLPKDRGKARILYCHRHEDAASIWHAAAAIADRVALAQGDRTGNDSAIIIRNLCLAKAAAQETEGAHDEG